MDQQIFLVILQERVAVQVLQVAQEIAQVVAVPTVLAAQELQAVAVVLIVPA
jgi:hypothetical protein